jgi:hypothetical protein
MAVLGFSDLKNTALPTLWDAAEITKARLADGSSLAALTGELRAALMGVNRELLAMAHYSDLFAVQDNPELEYPIGTTNGFEDATEYTAPDPRRGKTYGHMLPIKPYDRSLGWTMMYLRKARRLSLQADLQSVIIDARKLWQQKLLTRFFDDTANTVGSTSLADLPFANSTNDVSGYTPPVSPEGEEFASTHDHFLGSGTTGITASTLDQSAVDVALEHLQEHGHSGPFDLVGSRTDVSSWTDTTNVTGWKAPEWGGVMYHASAVERAAQPGIGLFYGYIESDYGIVRVWLTPRVPTNHFGVYQTYGPGDQRNPLRVRIASNIGFGFNLVPGNWVSAPGQMLVAYTEFGVGVGDRVGAVLVDVAASTYSAPTIS